MGTMPIEKTYTTQKTVQLLLDQFNQELSEYAYGIDIKAEWTYSSYMFTLKNTGDRRIGLCINLRSIQVERKLLSILHKDAVSYCASFIINYLRMIEKAYDDMPTTYFEGLAVFNMITDLQSSKSVKIYSPLCLLRGQKRKVTVRPLELWCAFIALKKISSEYLSEKAKKKVGQLIEDLQIYSLLPEVSYSNSYIPAHSLFTGLKQILIIVKNDKSVNKEFAILELLFCENIEHLSAERLAGLFLKTGNKFIFEILFRLMCHAPISHNKLISSEMYYPMEKHINEYRQQSVHYYQNYNKVKLLEDNYLFIRNTVGKANRLLDFYSMSASSGTIHTF